MSTKNGWVMEDGQLVWRGDEKFSGTGGGKQNPESEPPKDGETGAGLGVEEEEQRGEGSDQQRGEQQSEQEGEPKQQEGEGEGESQTPPPEDVRMAVASMTNEYWQAELLRHRGELRGVAGAFALKMVADALRGETDPEKLGVEGDHAEAINELVTSRIGGVQKHKTPSGKTARNVEKFVTGDEDEKLVWLRVVTADENGEAVSWSSNSDDDLSMEKAPKDTARLRKLKLERQRKDKRGGESLPVLEGKVVNG